MVQQTHFLARLAGVARHDAAARDRLTGQLRPYLELLVRRVLRRGPHSPLEHRISQVARRVLGEDYADDCSGELVGRICRGVVARLCGDAGEALPYETQNCTPHAWETAAALA